MAVSQTSNLNGYSANWRGTELLSNFKAKKKTDAITNEQKEMIMDQRRGEGRNVFLKQLANTSAIQSANAT